MTHRFAARLIVAVLPAALLLPTSASAEKVVTEDAAGDAQAVTSDTGVSSDELELTAAPDETATDITRTVVAHGNTRLSLTVHLRDLVLTSTNHQTYVRVVTPQGQYQVLVGKDPGSRARSELTRRGRQMECRALRAAVDGGTDTVLVTLPTTCIGTPRWVQVGVGVVRVAEPADLGGHTLFADDGHRIGDIRESDVAKGPKVRRG
jgi:hypothetical protein